MKNLAIAIVLLFSITVYAQSDKNRFQEIFDEEIVEQTELNRTSHSSLFQHTTAQKIPDWFINPPVGEGKIVYALGISDPAMDTIEAMDLALLRAQTMANILRKSTTQLLCDFFLNEAAQSSSVVYEHYSRISSILPDSEDNFELVNSFRNNYNETIVLIKYTPPTNIVSSNLQSIQLELYKNETESSIYGVFESVYEIKVKSNNSVTKDPLFYEITELGDRSSVVSMSYDKNIEVPIYTLGYMGIPSKDSLNQCYMTHGLWKDYFKSVMVHIIRKAREKPENISYLSDNYKRESFQKLTRGVSVNKMRFVINGFYTENGKLKIKMTEREL